MESLVSDIPAGDGKIYNLFTVYTFKIPDISNLFSLFYNTNVYSVQCTYMYDNIEYSECPGLYMKTVEEERPDIGEKGLTVSSVCKLY
jgi:hypothetical protein